jgi:hypothetical protein
MFKQISFLHVGCRGKLPLCVLCAASTENFINKLYIGKNLELNVCKLIAINLKINVKVKFTLQQATKSQRGVNVYLYSFCNLGARCGGRSTPRAGGFVPGNNPVTLVKGLGGAQECSGWDRGSIPGPFSL